MDLHFVAFVEHQGTLYELDGRKQRPIAHGPTTKETLAVDVGRVVQEFMQRDPDQLNFTLLALAPNMADDY